MSQGNEKIAFVEQKENIDESLGKRYESIVSKIRENGSYQSKFLPYMKSKQWESQQPGGGNTLNVTKSSGEKTGVKKVEMQDTIPFGITLMQTLSDGSMKSFSIKYDNLNNNLHVYERSFSGSGEPEKGKLQNIDLKDPIAETYIKILESRIKNGVLNSGEEKAKKVKQMHQSIEDYSKNHQNEADELINMLA